MEKIRHLSLRKSIFLYLIISLTISFFTSAIIIETAHRVQVNVWAKYINQNKYIELSSNNIERFGFDLSVSRPGSYIMSKNDLKISEICDLIETWTPLILSAISSALAVYLFYKDKLKKPLEILKNSSDNIADYNLDFKIEYYIKDEMGRLCNSFEHMRDQLDINNKQLWKMIEEQKNLKAAIAHDIRAPLAVLKGYHEMLLEFIPQDRIDKQKLIEILEAGYGQVERLTAFVDTMKQLSSLEDRKIEYDMVNTVLWKKRIEETIQFLTADRSLDYSLVVDPSVPVTFMADQAILMEVFENIISNAVRFASNRIIVFIDVSGNNLHFTVSDDGTGFKEENVNLITKAYYHDNPADQLNHFGLGLYISKILCERHGGILLLANKEDGGASVKAIFEIKSSKF